MKQLAKYIVGVLGFFLFFTSVSVAEKKFVPIVNDDLISMVSYYTTTNNLQVPILTNQNEYRDLVVQCEDDITYFIMAHRFYDTSLVTASSGNVVMDEKMTIQTNEGETAYIKGHIEGNESITITGKVYFNNTLYGEVAKGCTRTTSNVADNLQVPTFNGNSQGKLVIQCETDIVYYIMAYACLRLDTNPIVTTDNGTAITDERGKEDIVFYVKGHVERKNTDPVTIMGHVYSGGQDLYEWPDWTQTCP